MPKKHLTDWSDYETLCEELKNRIDAVVKRLFGDQAKEIGDLWLVSTLNTKMVSRDAACSIIISRFGDRAGSWKNFNAKSGQKEEGNILELIEWCLNGDSSRVFIWCEEFFEIYSQPESNRNHLFQPHLAFKVQTESEAAEETSFDSFRRFQTRLWKNQTATKWLTETKGISGNTVKKFFLGLAESLKLQDGRVCSNALCAPVMTCSGDFDWQQIYYPIPQVTVNPKRESYWCSGLSQVYYGAKSLNKKRIFVCNEIFDVWWLVQAATEDSSLADLLFVAATSPAIIPNEFKVKEFWHNFEKIYIGYSLSESGIRQAETLKKLCPLSAERIPPPEEFTDWADFFRQGGLIERFGELLTLRAPVMENFLTSLVESPPSINPSLLGEFAVEPVNCNGAYVNGFMYYPYRVEKREIERTTQSDGIVTESMVASYLTKVVRSDGAILDIEYLPAPRGTPPSERVLTLSDGTRIEQMPRPSIYATWHLESISEFIRWHRDGEEILHRPLSAILSDLETHYRQCVWLPYEEDYTVLALYTALSYVYNVFEAIPLLMVSGPKGTGKTELGLAMQAVAFNARTVGQGSAASLVRILHESRGLIIWDDLEALATKRETNAFSDLHQMLKLSYKKKTSKKAVTDRSGKTIIFDFYGPKVINNTSGVDPILGSRMITIPTSRIPVELRGKKRLAGSDPEFTFALRNELHIWGMSAAAKVEKHYRRLLIELHGDRKDEIFIPLFALASLAEEPCLLKNLLAASSRGDYIQLSTEEPPVLLRIALETCITEGFTNELALPHIQLQLASLFGSRQFVAHALPFWMQAQWIGNSMESLGFRDKKSKVRRARLYGKETRIYKLSDEFVTTLSQENSKNTSFVQPTGGRDPFDFCVSLLCADCSFAQICETTIPGLKTAKSKRQGYVF